MPFVNDQLAHNEVLNERQRYAKLAARRSRFRFEPEAVMALMRERILGQDRVLDSMDDLLYTLKADFNSPDRPLAVSLFLGPTGVGKTETVRVLAEAILGSAEHLCRIDMNTLAQEHYSAAITGSPPGYVGSKEGQTLFDEDKIKGSFSRPGIVLFDEIEKADKQVARAIMNILDTGKLVLSSGNRVIDFSNALIFMTSNLGVKELATKHQAHKNSGWFSGFKRLRSDQEILDQALRKHFDLEFINRIDRILPFEWLGEERITDLVKLELKHLNKRLAAKNAQLHCHEEVLNFLVKDYQSEYGARDLRRHIRRQLEPALARAMLQHEECNDFTAELELNRVLIEPST